MSQYTSTEKERRPPIEIGEDDGYDTAHFSIPQQYEGTLMSVMLPHGLVLDRVDKLARDIRHDYGEKTIHLLCVLKGGSAFFEDLKNALRRIHECSDGNFIPITFDFVRVKSYEGTESTGKVTIKGIDVASLAGRHVLVVEDIVDTGKTMQALLPVLEKDGHVKSVKVTSLLEKRTERSCGYKADYVGFTIPDHFVVGYCLDYDEAYRDLRHICVINEQGIEKFRHYEHEAAKGAAAAAEGGCGSC